MIRMTTDLIVMNGMKIMIQINQIRNTLRRTIEIGCFAEVGVNRFVILGLIFCFPMSFAQGECLERFGIKS